MTPVAKLRFKGWYSHHAICIYEDNDELPWLIVFDPEWAKLVDSEGHNLVDAEGHSSPAAKLGYIEARERTADAAKHTALALAQSSYLKKLPFQG
jgi:hypothetical protein